MCQQANRPKPFFARLESGRIKMNTVIASKLLLRSLVERLNDLGVPREYFDAERTGHMVYDGWILVVRDLGMSLDQERQISIHMYDPANPKGKWL